jgi:hypothetical protein
MNALFFKYQSNAAAGIEGLHTVEQLNYHAPAVKVK